MLIDPLDSGFSAYEVDRMCSNVITYYTDKYTVITKDMNDCINLKVTGTLQGIHKNAALVKGLETSNLHC